MIRGLSSKKNDTRGWFNREKKKEIFDEFHENYITQKEEKLGNYRGKPRKKWQK